MRFRLVSIPVTFGDLERPKQTARQNNLNPGAHQKNFGDWTFRSQDISLPGTKHKFWTFRSLDVSFLGRFVPRTIRSLFYSTVVKNYFPND